MRRSSQQSMSRNGVIAIETWMTWGEAKYVAENTHGNRYGTFGQCCVLLCMHE